MATTVYTYNDKVLKNVATDKWLKKKEGPAGFVMNASNATITSDADNAYVTWESPTYPNGYNGNGKQYVLVNNNVSAPTSSGASLVYSNSSGMPIGPNALDATDMKQLGTSTGTLLNNPAGGAFGKWLVWPINMTLEQAQAYMANVTITILDP